MSFSPSSASFHHLPALIKDKILILLQSNNFTDAKQLYDKAIQRNSIKNTPLLTTQKNDAYYE